MKLLTLRFRAVMFAVTVALAGSDFLFAQDHPNPSASASDILAADNLTSNKGAQIAALYRLQAAFHREATVRDPVNGDSEEVINQRIVAMLSLWTEDGWLFLDVGGARDGYYLGKGDPSDPSACPTPSDSYGNRGTLCTFFKYVAGSFQAANKFVSLAPSYNTQFRIRGNNATVYFECHYFNVAMDPTSGRPLWTAASHIIFDGGARMVDGRWRLSYAHAPVAGVPIP